MVKAIESVYVWVRLSRTALYILCDHRFSEKNLI